jgi:hypothetical protein
VAIWRQLKRTSIFIPIHILILIPTITSTSIYMNMLIRISIPIRKSILIPVNTGLMSTNTLTIVENPMSIFIRKGSYYAACGFPFLS